jgi:hypothetical protein
VIKRKYRSKEMILKTTKRNSTMKRYAKSGLVIFCVLLINSSLCAQNPLEVAGELTINPADSAINVHGNSIQNLADPVLSKDEATKAYVDQVLLTFGISMGPSGIQGLLNAGYSPLSIIDKGAPLTDFIGLSHEGGIIFYMNPSGDGSGLVAASSNQSGAVSWGCHGSPISGADGTDIGTGNQNTLDIEAGCTNTGTAADMCANLSLNGFDDWFLPSKDELNEMYLKIGPGATNVGNFSPTYYWSSSEVDNNLA